MLSKRHVFQFQCSNHHQYTFHRSLIKHPSGSLGFGLCDHHTYDFGRVAFPCSHHNVTRPGLTGCRPNTSHMSEPLILHSFPPTPRLPGSCTQTNKHSHTNTQTHASNANWVQAKGSPGVQHPIGIVHPRTVQVIGKWILSIEGRPNEIRSMLCV